MSSSTGLKITPGTKVAPGDRIGPCSTTLSTNKSSSSLLYYQPGPGTYIRGNHIYSSTIGTLQIQTPQQDPNNNNNNDEMKVQETTTTHILQVVNANKHYNPMTQILSVGQIILGKVLRIMPQQATIQIIAIEPAPSAPTPNNGTSEEEEEAKENNFSNNATSGIDIHKYQHLKEHPIGIIRTQDVKLLSTTTATNNTDLNANVISESFQPNDVIVAKIISMGDTKKYFLSTADGVDLGVVRATCQSSGSVMIPVSWKEMECPVTGIRESRKCAKPSSS